MLLFGEFLHAEHPHVVVQVVQHVGVLVSAEPFVFPVKSKGLVAAEELRGHVLVLTLPAVGVQIDVDVVVGAHIVEGHLFGAQLGRDCLFGLVRHLFSRRQVLLLSLALSLGITNVEGHLGHVLVARGHAVGGHGDPVGLAELLADLGTGEANVGT